jgi:hypothetical protein
VEEIKYEPPPPGPPIEDVLYDDIKFFSASAASLFNRCAHFLSPSTRE